MDYNKILNKAKLEESKNVVKMYEAKYYEALTDTLQLMEESEQNEVLSKMDEKALFGSMASQVKKMTKQVTKTQGALTELKTAIASDPTAKTNQNLIALAKNVDGLLLECGEILKALQEPTFVGNYTIIDNNTGLFGKNKGNGLSSKDFKNL